MEAIFNGKFDPERGVSPTAKHYYILNIHALGLVVSETKPMVDNDALGAWLILTKGTWLAAFISGIRKYCYTQSSGCHGF